MPDADRFQPDWPSYYQAVTAQPPRHTLVRTLALMHARTPGSPESSTAIDLGCGSGRDTRLLLERSWQVRAIDAETSAIAHLETSLDDRPQLRDRLEIQVCPFEEIHWPPAVQLVNASFSLPFCPPDRFGELWQAIEVALEDGGWFCGQFFGDRDEWAQYSNVTTHSREAVADLFANFTIVELNEAEYDGTTATNTPKHWHIFHAIARRSQP